MNPNDNLFYYIAGTNNDDDRSRYKHRIKELNMLLSFNGFSEMGDLFDNSMMSVNKTINLVQQLLEDRQKHFDQKTDLMKKVARTEEEYFALIEKTDGNKAKNVELNNRITSIKQKFTNDEKRFKEDFEKLKNEKNDIERLNTKLMMKESQYKHEIRKLEKEIEDFKLRLKKMLSDKEGLKLTNSNPNKSFNISQLDNNNISQNIKLSVTLNSILPDNEARNSKKVLQNVDNLKEFYNLIFQAYQEKINLLLGENSDLKECYKLISHELSEFLDSKKTILYKFSQDTLGDLKNLNSFVSPHLFDLNFIDSRDEILKNFNDILNAFRFTLIYDTLKVDPTNEFEYDEIKKLVNNRKYNIEDIPLYSGIKRHIDSFDLTKLKNLKEEIIKAINNKSNYSSSKRKFSKDEIFTPDSISDRYIVPSNPDYKYIESLEEINKSLTDAMESIDSQFNHLNKHLEVK